MDGTSLALVLRNPVVTALTAAVVMLAALGVVGLAMSRAAISRERDNVEIQRRKAVASLGIAKEQRDIAKEQRDSANRSFYLAQVPLAWQAWEADDVGRAESLLDALAPTVGQIDLRGWEWYYLKALCHCDRLTVRDVPGANQWLAWSPDGTRIASAGDDGRVTVRDVAGRRTLVTIRGTGNPITALAWSPDGTRLASADNDGFERSIRVWNAATGREAQVIRWQGNPATALFWSPDGTRLAASSSGSFKVVDAATGEVIRDWVKQAWAEKKPPEFLTRLRTQQVVWSPDGKRTASINTQIAPGTSPVSIRDPDSGARDP